MQLFLVVIGAHYIWYIFVLVKSVAISFKLIPMRILKMVHFWFASGMLVRFCSDIRIQLATCDVYILLDVSLFWFCTRIVRLAYIKTILRAVWKVGALTSISAQHLLVSPVIVIRGYSLRFLIYLELLDVEKITQDLIFNRCSLGRLCSRTYLEWCVPINGVTRWIKTQVLSRWFYLRFSLPFWPVFCRLWCPFFSTWEIVRVLRASEWIFLLVLHSFCGVNTVLSKWVLNLRHQVNRKLNNNRFCSLSVPLFLRSASRVQGHFTHSRIHYLEINFL